MHLFLILRKNREAPWNASILPQFRGSILGWHSSSKRRVGSLNRSVEDVVLGDRAIASIVKNVSLTLRHLFSGSGEQKSTLVCRSKLDLLRQSHPKSIRALRFQHFARVEPIRLDGEASPFGRWAPTAVGAWSDGLRSCDCPVLGESSGTLAYFRSGPEPPVLRGKAPRIAREYFAISPVVAGGKQGLCPLAWKLSRAFTRAYLPSPSLKHWLSRAH